MSNRIILGMLNPVQRQVLEHAAKRVDSIRQGLDRAVGQYKELLAMGMPTGANGYDSEEGLFYFEEPTEVEGPVASGPRLVIPDDEKDQQSDTPDPAPEDEGSQEQDDTEE